MSADPIRFIAEGSPSFPSILRENPTIKSDSNPIPSIRGAGRYHPPSLKDWLRENAISLASAIIALAALSLAIYTAWLNRDYLRKSHRPQMGGSFWYNENGSGFEFGNIGVGVAYLKWFQVEVDRKPVNNWGSMINALHLSDDTPPKAPVSMDQYIHFNNPRPVYAPGQTYPHFTVSPGPPEAAFHKQGERVNLRACYCSLFDECWEVNSLTNVPKPREDACFPYPDVRFGVTQPAE